MTSQADESRATDKGSSSQEMQKCPCCGARMQVTDHKPNSVSYKCKECGLSDTKLIKL